MLHENINISCLTVHAQKVDEVRSERESRDAKRARSFGSGSSNSRPDMKDKLPRLKKRLS